MGDLLSAFRVNSLATAMPLAFAVILLLILIVSFRSRAVVFCQYLEAMTGIKLRPAQVARIFAKKGREGVRELFLDLIIREDLKQGPIDIPGSHRAETAAPPAGSELFS
jgi:hypothetical protein